MRTNEERIAAMHKRAEEISGEHRVLKVRAIQTVSAAVFLAAAVMIAVFIPKLPGSGAGGGIASDDMYASIFGGSNALSYILIAVIGFTLGVTVTVFCYRLNKISREEHNYKKRV